LTLNSHDELQKAIRPDHIDAIVVRDLLKGTVSPDLIRFIAQRLKNKPWFVSSKAYCPEWIREIDPECVRLIEIPQAAVREKTDRENTGGWLTRAGGPTSAALEEIEKLSKRYTKAVLFAAPSDQAVIARGHPTDSEAQGVIWLGSHENPTSVGVPRASVCFAAITALMLAQPSLDLESLVNVSLSFTDEWRSYEVGRVVNPTSWDPLSEPVFEASSKTDPSAVRYRAFSWGGALEQWRAAFRDYGIVNDGKKQLQLWRGMTEVKNYICICESKRRVLREIVREVKAFKREPRIRSCMIAAPPGSGKSILAEHIAEDCDLMFLEFNITQMFSRSDILDCFDAILTTQFENRDRHLLVFVDEIDGDLGGPVYDSFLGPLERGVYRRAGKTFPIKPCFWLFAGTKNPENLTDKKAKDFVSRLTLKPRDMGIRDGDDFNLENVYLGAAILRAEFPDVRQVSMAVLDTFHKLGKEVSIRTLRHFIKDFNDIQSGTVFWRNIPLQWIAELRIKSPVEDREDLVEVVGDPISPSVFARYSLGQQRFAETP
jgi:ATPase family protein associated with various cellular activities (AAA)